MSKSLTTAGIALISIGIGLISYAWLQPFYVKIALIAIGVVFNVFAVIAFVKVPASDKSQMADAIKEIQKMESQLSPFLQKYGNDIESAIEAIVSSEIGKIDQQHGADIDKLQKQIDELKQKQ